MLKLSIITTLYNSAPYMQKCIDTLIDQDIAKDEYEIILVNDASPDNSLEIAESYAKEHENIRILSYSVNKGLAGARQFGTDAAQGKYTCYVDPDDYIKPNSLSHLLKKMEDENLDILRFNYQMVDENYSFIEKPKEAQLIDYSPLAMAGKDFLCKRLGYACFVWAYIYRSKIIKDNNIRFCQGDYFDDTAWLPKVLCAAEKVDTINEARYFYLQRRGSLVNIRNEAAVKAKLESTLFLIEQFNNSYRKDRSIKWFREMSSRLTLNVLSELSTTFYNKKKEYIQKLKAIQWFPIYSDKVTVNTKIKYMIASISLNLYCYIFHNR